MHSFMTKGIPHGLTGSFETLGEGILCKLRLKEYTYADIEKHTLLSPHRFCHAQMPKLLKNSAFQVTCRGIQDQFFLSFLIKLEKVQI